MKKQTSAQILKKLTAFAIPLILSGMLQQLFNWVDALIVGNVIGETALAAVGATASVYNLFVMMENMENELDVVMFVDDEGNEFELEVLSTLEYNGNTYLAVIPAAESLDELQLEVSILKSVEEDGDPILCAIEDEQELETVYNLIMDQLYEEEES